MQHRRWYLAVIAFVALGAERLIAARDKVDRGALFTTAYRRDHLELIVLQGVCLLIAAGLAVLLALGLRPRRGAVLGIGVLLLVNAAVWLVPDLMRVTTYP